MSLKETYNEIAPIWAENKWQKRSVFCDDLLNILASRIGVGSEVLDLGCGSGEDCKYLTDLGLKPLGVDFSDGLIKEAKKRFPQGKFILQDFRELDFPAGKFSGVVAKHSLLHLPKKELPSVLKKIWHIMKKDGLFVTTVYEGIGESEVENTRFGRTITRFYAYYTNFEMKKLLTDAGFEVLEEGIYRHEQGVSLKFLAQKV